jgi:cold shock CspA family protein
MADAQEQDDIANQGRSESKESPHIAKWGFGMAPISHTMQRRYDRAVQTALDLIDGNLAAEEVSLDDISELKGMFNRCLRRDQWDWFSVFTAFGEPSRKAMQQIVRELPPLRRAVAASDLAEIDRLTSLLVANNVLHLLHTYQLTPTSRSQVTGSGWVYILSTREQPDVLKIGMTTRTVAERVKEINSATGVLIPFSATHVFRVLNVAQAEKEIHQRLAEHRVRQDREFFRLPFSAAVRCIERYIEAENIASRHVGTLLWFDSTKRFGFIASKDNEDLFVHVSQLSKDALSRLEPGVELEFDLGRRPQGPCALRVTLKSPE